MALASIRFRPSSMGEKYRLSMALLGVMHRARLCRGRVWLSACSAFFFVQRLVALLQFVADLPALQGLALTAFGVGGAWLQSRDRCGFALFIHRDHGEEATVGVAHP